MFKNQDIRCRLRAPSRIHVLSSGLNSFNFIIFNIIGSQEKAIQYFHLGYCLAFFSDTCRFYLDQIDKN